MRARIAIIDKCLLIHDLLTEENQILDYAFMCIEILLAIVSFVEVDTAKVKKYFDISNPFPLSSRTDTTVGLQYIAQKYTNQNKQYKYYYTEHMSHYLYVGDIWGVALAAYRCAIGFEEDRMLYGNQENSMIKSFAVDFWHLLQAMC